MQTIIASPVSLENIAFFEETFKNILERNLQCVVVNKPLDIESKGDGQSKYITIFKPGFDKNEADKFVLAWNCARLNKNVIKREGNTIVIKVGNGELIEIFFEKRSVGFARFSEATKYKHRHEKDSNAKSYLKKLENIQQKLTLDNQNDVEESYYYPEDKEPIGVMRIADHKEGNPSFRYTVKSVSKTIDIDETKKKSAIKLEHIKEEIKDFFIYICQTINVNEDLDILLKPIFNKIEDIEQQRLDEIVKEERRKAEIIEKQKSIRENRKKNIRGNTQNILNAFDGIVD